MSRARVEQWIHVLLRPFGVDLKRYAPLNFPNLRRARILKHQGISAVLDVGANIGQNAARLRTDGFDGRILSFEPQSEAFAELEQPVLGLSGESLEARVTTNRAPYGVPY